MKKGLLLGIFLFCFAGVGNGQTIKEYIKKNGEPLLIGELYVEDDGISLSCTEWQTMQEIFKQDERVRVRGEGNAQIDNVYLTGLKQIEATDGKKLFFKINMVVDLGYRVRVPGIVIAEIAMGENMIQKIHYGIFANSLLKNKKNELQNKINSALAYILKKIKSSPCVKDST